MDLVSIPGSGQMKCVSCGTTLFTPNYAKIDFGTIINGFLIESKIGQGGMGVVYKAKQLNLERYVALKVLAEHLADDDEFVERFFKEARAAANLNHQNIVQVYDAGSTIDGIYYFAMELIEGETIDARLLRDGEMPPKDALDVAGKIARALEYAWDRQNLTHGDIKPDNIITNTSGGVKLADLGLAKSIHDEKTIAEGGLMATPMYAPPEIISGDLSNIGFRSDMYSFGATLYHMLVGVPPFYSEDPEQLMQMHLTEKHVPVNERNRELNHSISDLVDKLLMKAPSDRPESWTEVASSIERIKDLERKIFHISHFQNSSTEIEHGSDEKKSFGLLGFLISASIIILILAGAVFSIYVRNSSNSRAEENLPETSKKENANLPQREWSALKAKLKAMPPREALGALEEYMSRNKVLPEDASALYEATRIKVAEQVAKEQSKKNIEDRISKQAEDIINSCSQEVLSGKSYSELQFLLKRIETTLAVASSKKINVNISKENRDKLNSAYTKLMEISATMRKGEKDKYLRSIEEEKQKKIEQLRIARENAERERDERMKLNQSLDNYYMSLAEKKSPSDLKSDMDNVLKIFGEKLPIRLRESANFISKNYSSAPEELINQMIKAAPSLKDKFLPLASVGKGFKIQEINDKGIRLQMTVDKMKMSKLVQWHQLSADENGMLINKCIIANESYIPNPSDISSFCSYMVERGFLDQAVAFLNKFSVSLNAPHKSDWMQFIEDKKKASRELESIRAITSMLESQGRGHFTKASGELVDVLVKHSDSDAFSRYSEEIKTARQELAPFDHMIGVLDFFNEAKKMSEGEEIFDVISRVYCARARFINQEGTEDLKEKLSWLENPIVAKLAKDADVNKMSAPFYSWEKESIGDSVKFAETSKTPEFLRVMVKKPEIGNFIDMAGKLSRGDWSVPKAYNPPYGEIMDLDGKISYIMTSLVFSASVYSNRFGNAEQLSLAQSNLETLCGKFENSPTGFALSTLLSTENAISNGDFSRASNIITAYFKKSNRAARDIDFRICMLSNYVSLNRGRKDFSTMQDEWKQSTATFNGDRELSDDMIWINHSYSIFGGKNLSDKELAELSSTNPKNIDICSRTMLSILSIRANNGTPVKAARQIARIIRSKIKGMTAQSRLFANLSYFRLALNCETLEEFKKETDLILAEPAISGIPSYPALSMFSLASTCAVYKIDKEAMRELLLKRLLASSVSSVVEVEVVKQAAETGNYENVIAGIFSKGFVEKAFTSAIFFYLCSIDDPNLKNAIVKELDNNKMFLNSEQIYLINSIKKIKN